MFAKFVIEGFIASAEVKESKNKPGNVYGQITVGCGTVSHEFFVEAEDIDKGKYKPQQTVKISGTIGKRGYNPQLNADKIEVVKGAA